ERGLAVLLYGEVQEIRLAMDNGESQGPEPLRQVGHPLGVQPAALADVLFVREGGQRGLLREAVRVERRPDTVQVLHDLRRRQAVADPQSREPVDLREDPQQHYVAPGLG